MSNINGKKYGFTGLFPIKEQADCGALRDYLRALDQNPCGSPLSAAPIIHMARFVIIDRLPFQGIPAAFDRLRSCYLLFACEFDGPDVATLVHALVTAVPDEIAKIWKHCIGFPGLASVEPTDPDNLVQYFSRCQVTTNLFLADQPERSVPEILKGLVAKRRFAEFLEQHQGAKPAILQQRFQEMWREVAAADPKPGSL
jgi:hypothetical protein